MIQCFVKRMFAVEPIDKIHQCMRVQEKQAAVIIAISESAESFRADGDTFSQTVMRGRFHFSILPASMFMVCPVI